MSSGFNTYLLNTKVIKVDTSNTARAHVQSAFNVSDIYNTYSFSALTPKVYTATTGPDPVIFKKETCISKATAQEIYLPLDFALLSRVNMYVYYGSSNPQYFSAQGGHIIAYIGTDTSRPGPQGGAANLANQHPCTNHATYISLRCAGTISSNKYACTYFAGVNRIIDNHTTAGSQNIRNITYNYNTALSGKTHSDRVKAYINAWYLPAQADAAAVTDPNTGDIITPATGRAQAVNAYVKYIEFYYKVNGVDTLIYTLG